MSGLVSWDALSTAPGNGSEQEERRRPAVFQHPGRPGWACGRGEGSVGTQVTPSVGSRRLCHQAVGAGASPQGTAVLSHL